MTSKWILKKWNICISLYIYILNQFYYIMGWVFHRSLFMHILNRIGKEWWKREKFQKKSSNLQKMYAHLMFMAFAKHSKCRINCDKAGIKPTFFSVFFRIFSVLPQCTAARLVATTTISTNEVTRIMIFIINSNPYSTNFFLLLLHFNAAVSWYVIYTATYCQTTASFVGSNHLMETQFFLVFYLQTFKKFASHWDGNQAYDYYHYHYKSTLSFKGPMWGKIHFASVF